MARYILVTGATGNQGGSVIDALANKAEFVLLAVTRNATGSGAQKLRDKGNNIKVVQGDQNDVPGLFKNAQEAAGGAGLWGVYSVQISQGSGVTHEGEITQGKAMIDESVRAGVKHFVYSSVDRGGDETSWTVETPIPHFQSKYHIEHHLKDNAGSMGWTILRPVAFMDNLQPGFPAKVFVAALRDTLGSKPLQWIATKDIGAFVGLAFERPEKFNHKAIGLAGDSLNTEQLAHAFQNKTGYPLEGTFWAFGFLLKSLVTEVRLMINWFGSDGYGVDIAALRKMHPGLLNMESWIAEESSFPKST